MAETTVEGTVSRVFYEGKGLEVVETYTAAGKEVSKRWTAWFRSPHGISEGAAVTLTGTHSDGIDEWAKDGETRRSVKRALNETRVVSKPDIPF